MNRPPAEEGREYIGQPAIVITGVDDLEPDDVMRIIAGLQEHPVLQRVGATAMRVRNFRLLTPAESGTPLFTGRPEEVVDDQAERIRDES